MKAQLHSTFTREVSSDDLFAAPEAIVKPCTISLPVT